MNDIAAIILAGGRSRRMGRDKALLRLTAAGPTLIELVIAAARTVTETIALSANDPAPYAWLGVPIVADQIPDVGPLAGLAAGLASLKRPALLLGCDMPFVAPALLRLIVARLTPAADAVAPLNAAGEPEPLCAIYRPTCLPAIQARIARGEYAMRGWLSDVRVAFVSAADARAVDPALRSFQNLNSPRDLPE